MSKVSMLVHIATSLFSYLSHSHGAPLDCLEASKNDEDILAEFALCFGHGQNAFKNAFKDRIYP
jgi:hypothetical protein